MSRASKYRSKCEKKLSTCLASLVPSYDLGSGIFFCLGCTAIHPCLVALVSSFLQVASSSWSSTTCPLRSLRRCTSPFMKWVTLSSIKSSSSSANTLTFCSFITNYAFTGFGGEYFANSEDGKNATLSKDGQSCLVGYRSILNTKATEESLANFAWWEPSHGQFTLRHPWKLYLKVTVLVRQCSYQVETLNGYINYELK
ncbi:hypothetical protein RJ639_006009, partial [Escallonia herrerae]